MLSVVGDSQSLWVWTGIIGSGVAIGAALVRVCVALGRAVIALVHFKDTLTKQAALPVELAAFREDFRRHAADDITFQRWIVRKLDITEPLPTGEGTTTNGS